MERSKQRKIDGWREGLRGRSGDRRELRVSAVIRITAEGTNGGQPCVNVFHWRIPNSAPTTEVGGIATALQTFYNAIKGSLNAGTITIGSHVVTVDQVPNVVIAITPLTVASTGGAVVSAGTAGVVSWQTGVVGRSFRGRNYFGPISTTSGTAQDGHNLLGTFQVALQSAADTLRAVTTNGVSFVVWSKKVNGSTNVTGAIARANLGTQRRRTSL